MMKKSHLILIITVIIGVIIVSLDFEINSDNDYANLEQKSQLEKLIDYKSSLEEVNQFNNEHLLKLEKEFGNATTENKNSIKNEIDIVKKIIKENSEEIQKIAERIENQK